MRGLVGLMRLTNGCKSLYSFDLRRLSLMQTAIYPFFIHFKNFNNFKE